jgi:hypothetical protein
MTFTEAIKRSLWVRRKGQPVWFHVPRDRKFSEMHAGRVGELVWADLVADDWEVHQDATGAITKERDDDDVSLRFSLLELE